MQREIVAKTIDVKRHYETKGGCVKAVDGVTMQVEAGEFLAIAGPSGSGKSTLLNLLGMLDEPTDGRIRLEGRDIEGLSRTERARIRRDHIGFIFQAYNLIPVLTVAENVEYVMVLQGQDTASRRQRALEVLAEVELEGKEDRFPQELSGGQQQRVAVARAIASRPALILADEPTANLDSKTAIALIDMMERINREQGTTFVFSTHDPRIMKRSSRMIRICDGKLEEEAAEVLV